MKRERPGEGNESCMSFRVSVRKEGMMAREETAVPSLPSVSEEGRSKEDGEE